ncbi:MAG: M14 family metallopeptidase [Defluviitaleaceae bacterium]|nr:M14 family metallopeptidase [Defluviitaleaceae bacterium]MCL2274729.1 M14 family metallopeptidase [Defluviitaleaceae bacterium]
MLLNYDRYLVFEELTKALHDLAAAFPQLAQLRSIGKSGEGRDLWLMEITDTRTGTADSKPAYLIDGNHHAGEVTGSMVALYTIDELLSRAEEPEFGELLKRYTFYILPRLSPDGAEVYLTTPNMLRSAPRPYPFTEKLAGLTPEDINGDGKILLMRVATPLGNWKEDPADSRRMLKRLPDEEGGTYYAIYQEGLIHEFDGHTFEQAPTHWGLDFNRNYPEVWALHHKMPGAGNYPLSEPETRALANFVISHPNIGGVSTLHTTGGVIIRPPSIKPEKDSDKGDMRIFKEIGAMATEETGYPCVHCRDGFFLDPELNPLSGAFDDWLYSHMGIPGYTVELWDLHLRAGVQMWPRKAKESGEIAEDYAKVLKWIDTEMQGEGFTPWTPFTHPQLGAVEIGGFDMKFLQQNCPPRFLKQECEKNARFFYRHARTLPRLVLDKPEITKLDESTWKIGIDVLNLGYLATYLTQMAQSIKITRPVKITLQGAEILDGKAERELPQLEGRAAIREGYGFGAGNIVHQKKHVSWIIRAKTGDTITLHATSQKAGNPSLEVVLKND